MAPQVPTILSYSPCVPNPKPEQTVGRFDGDSTVVETDPRGPEAIDPLEMQRRVFRVALEKGKRLVSELLNFLGERSVAGPEVRRGVVIQSLVD
jgi:hypothetical protein